MEKGLAVIEVTDTEVKKIRIDQDVLEFARLNAQTRKRLEDSEAAKLATTRSNHKAEKAEARRKAFTIRNVRRVLAYGGIAGAVTLAGTAGMITPIIHIPVALFCLSAACLHLGMLFGRGRK